MYCIKTTRQDDDLDDLVCEAMRLPINLWLKNEYVEVKAYYRDELENEEAGTIRPATEVEVAEVKADAIIMISSTDTATYSHLDMLVLISDLLNTLDLRYNGRDDTPVVSIKNRGLWVNPAVYKYFGSDNQVLGPTMGRLIRTEHTESYCPTDSDIPDPAMQSVYKRMTTKAAPDEDVPGGGIYKNR